MTGPSDSSGSLPPLDGSEPQHEDLLVSDKLHGSIALVARRQGVRECDETDVVQETLARALRMRLPADPDEARKYIHGIAKRVAIDLVEHGARTGDEYVEEAPDSDRAPHGATASAQPALFDDRDVARKVVDAARSRFPVSFSYFFQERVLGRSADQIANDHEVHPGHVRKEIAAMQRFVSDYGAKLGASVAVLLLLVAGYAAWRARNPESEWATLHEVQRTEPRPLDPDAQVTQLRERARWACDHDAFEACLADTEAADALDPVGAETWKSVREQALRGLQVREHESNESPTPAPRPAPRATPSPGPFDPK